MLISRGFLDDSNPLELNLLDPVYETASRPDFDQLPLISDRETETRRLGVFIQDRILVSDNLSFLAGLRYDTVEQIVTNHPTDFDPTFTEVTQNNDALTPRLGVVYKPVDKISLYTSYSRSFAPNPETTVDGTSLEPEESEGFEVGVKTELLKEKLSTTLAYFNITKQNVASEDPENPFSFVATGEQQSQGIELDVSGQLLPGWNAIASYAFIDAKVTEDNAIEVGNRLPNAPEHSAGLWTTYEIQKSRFKGLGFGIGFNFVGAREGDLNNSFQLDSYFIANAAVFYRRNNWRVALNFRNLFDEDYIAGTSTVRERGNDPGEPFTVIGSVSLEF
jgi:iron complex outermembrane receptor protein